MPTLGILTVPTSSTFVSQAGSWASVLNDDAVLIAAILAGISVVFILLSGVLGKVIGGFSRVAGRGRSGGMSRRRR